MRGTLVRDLALVSGLALAARLVAAALVGYAPYTDPGYYTLVARELATGHGFSVPVIWSFLEVGGRLPNPATLPVPSNGHWMPLTSLLAAGFMAVLGPTWRAGQIPMVILSAALVPITFAIAWELFRSRWVAWLSAILAIFAGPLLLYYPTIENFAVFGVAGSLSLYGAMRATRSQRWVAWLAVSGALAGLATLARIDGILLLAAPGTAWLVRRGWAGARGWAAGAGAIAAFLVVIAPWMLRNAAVFGTPLPSAGGHTLFIISYNQQFSIGQPVTLAGYLDWGWANIIGSKLNAAFDILGRTAVLLGGFFVFTFIPGLWIHRHRRDLTPFTLYWLVMFVVMAVVFTFHAPAGAFYHSAPAWLPFAIPVAVASLDPVANWLGRFWHFLRRPQTQRFLGVVAVAGAIVLSLVGSSVIYGQWTWSHERDVQAADWFERTGHTNDVVLYSDPATLSLLSGNPGVAAPFDPYPVIKEVVDAYDVRWVVVQLSEGSTRDALNLWSGPAGADIDGNHASWLASTPAYEAPGLRIWEVTGR